jgi:hypothetical protein
MQNRVAGLQEMLNIFYTLLDDVEQGRSCKITNTNKKNRDGCHALTLGFLIRGFKVLGHCVLRLEASSFHQSVSTVYDALSKIEVYTWPDDVYGWNAHALCDFRKDMRSKLTEVYINIKSPVVDSHRVHMEKQWVKGRPHVISRAKR